MRHSRIFAIFSFVTASLFLTTGVMAQSNAPRELVILNWEEYLDPELVAEFETAFDAKVREVHFENDSERDKLLIKNDGKGYDIAIVDGTSIEKYRKLGWLVQINEAQIPNLSHIYDRWRNAHKDAFEFAVPYFWGTMGIAYRSDLVDSEIKSWMQLFKPPEDAKGRIAMIGDPRDLVAPAMMALGHSPNSADATHLDHARNLLLGQKPDVRSYSYVSLDENSSLVTGDVAMALMFSGDALALQEYNEEITYVVPQEGTILWVDYLAILEGSKNKDLAAAFINFINEPEAAARQAEYVYYPTPNKSAESLLPAEFLEDDVIYPPQSVLDRSSFFEIMPAASWRRYASIYAAVTR